LNFLFRTYQLKTYQLTSLKLTTFMLKDEIVHFILSIIAGAIVGYFCRNWWAVPIALVSGFLIDADHLIDYFIYKKFRGFDLKEFLSGEFFDRLGKVYVVFHGYEYAAAATIFGIIFPNLGWLFFSLALSNFLHLLYDTIANKPIWPTYFITYRLIKNFNHKTFDFKCDNR